MIFDKFKIIKELTSVCIVAKSNNARFNFLERYIYNNIAKLFAKDLISNFIFLFTFCDIREPLTAKMFKKENSFYNNIIKKIKEPWFLQFNNSEIFTENQNKFTCDYVNLCYDSFNKLINKLKTLKKCSVKLSEEINQKRIELDQIYNMILNRVKVLNKKYSNFYNKLTNDEKKDIFNILYKYEIFIQNYNDISIKESRDNLNDFFLALNNNNNNLNKKLIKDIIKQYNGIKNIYENIVKSFDCFLNLHYK